MMPFDILIKLFEMATQPWSPTPWCNAKPPTQVSIETIHRELGIRIPEDFVRLATSCPSYGSWLASLGEDFENGWRITRLNELFHDARRMDDGENSQALPKHLVMLNHGHDGDCDCWDTRVVTASGEHPVVYVSLEGTEMKAAGRQFDSFSAYAENFALRASSVPDKSQRRIAKRLIQGLGHSIKNPASSIAYEQNPL